MQKTELNAVIKVKTPYGWKEYAVFPCGLRQKNYNHAYKQAQDLLQTLNNTARLVMEYRKTFIPNGTKQLSII